MAMNPQDSELMRLFLEGLKSHFQEQGEKTVSAFAGNVAGMNPQQFIQGNPQQTINMVNAIHERVKLIKEANRTLKELDSITKEEVKAAKEVKEAKKKEATLGRLPLASVPAALRGSQTAGARVGYALGGFAGLGLGVAGAGMIGAGFSASANGTDVVMKPFTILASTIGMVVLPALVHFGAALLDVADFIQGKKSGGAAVAGGITAAAVAASGPVGWTAALAAAGTAAVANKGNELLTGKPEPGQTLKPTLELTEGAKSILNFFSFGLLEKAAKAGEEKRAASADDWISDVIPHIVNRDGPNPIVKVETVDDQIAGPPQRTHSDNVRSLLREMLQSTGPTPHFTGLDQLQKEMQVRGLQSDLEQRQKQIYLEGISRIEAGLTKVETAVRGGP